MELIFKKFNRLYQVKERIFIYYMAFSVLLSSVTILTNIIYGFNFSYNYKWIAITVFCGMLLAAALQRRRLELTHRIGVYSLLFVFLPLSWLSSSGLVSPSIMYSFLLLIFINYLTGGKERLMLNGMAILLHILLISLYYYHHEYFKIMTARDQFMDWMMNVPLGFAFIALLLITFENAYEVERTMNEEKSERLNILIRTDYLTGLYNRVYLKEKLVSYHSVFTRSGEPYSVIILDVDHFKEYNDYYGHLKGDDCLKLFGNILKKSVNRDTDWVCRYGGEEFCAILGFTDKPGACTVAKRIHKVLKEADIPHYGSPLGKRLTTSSGISTINITIEDPLIMLKYADKALYRSKSSGRDQICHFDDQEYIQVK